MADNQEPVTTPSAVVPNQVENTNEGEPKFDSSVETGEVDQLAALQGLVPESEIKAILDSRKAEAAKNVEPAAADVKVEADKKAAEEKAAADKKEAEDKTEEKKNEGQDKKNILGLNKKKEASKPETPYVIENQEHILEIVKSKFGQDVKEVKDLGKFFATAETWRKESQKVSELDKQLKAHNSLWENLPQEFIDSAQDYLKGNKDYAKHLTQKPPFDFNAPAEKQDIKTLVNHFFPNKFTEDDFKDENKSELLKMAEETAIERFGIQKQKMDLQRAAVADKVQKQEQAFKQSVNSSVESLRKTFPDTEDGIIKEISTTLEGGTNKILSFFYNEDGSLNPDAAKRLLMAKYGEDQIEFMMGTASHIAETKTNEDLLSRGADRPSVVKSQVTNNEVSEDVQNMIKGIAHFHKKPTY